MRLRAITLIILDYVLFKNEESYYNGYRFKNIETNNELSNLKQTRGQVPCLMSPSIITTDIFADIFSVVTMNKSYLADHNLLITHTPDKLMDLFEDYFDKLIKYALENKEMLKHKKMDIVW